MKLPAGLTAKKILAAAKRSQQGMDSLGFCLACGAKAEGVEPDARKCECEMCGQAKVYGAEELAIYVAF